MQFGKWKRKENQNMLQTKLFEKKQNKEKLVFLYIAATM